MSAAEVLVIFLSVALAIFLVLAIILIAYLIVVAKKIKRIADTAEAGVQGVVGVIANLQRVIAPAMVTRVVSDLVNRFTGDGHKSKKGD